jgi:cytochrome c-type biogenesis protein CcmF
MLPAVFLMGVAPFARWKQASVGELARTLRWAFLAAALVGVARPSWPANGSRWSR